MSGVQVPLSLKYKTSIFMNSKIIFLFFSIVLFVSSLSVVILQNSVHSVVCLVLSFISSSGILLLFECEFFAFLFIIVYVGAIAVLFLFVVMMLDIKNLPTNKTSNLKYFIFGVFTALSFLILVMPTLTSYYESNPYGLALVNNVLTNWYNEDVITEVEALGQVLYTHYVLQFLTAGLILFLAVVGVVVLTVNLTAKNLSTNVKQISRVTGLQN
jgi:NADH-quinone oxidoreductase subunit J|tara:strand:+ start:637 stop:1278 length:642 start_codon:yes stop_codon:yes gene_type:complete